MRKSRRVKFGKVLLGILGFAVFVTALANMGGSANALVGVGELVHCIESNPVTASFGNNGLDNDDAEAQSFTLTTSTVISAVKINAYKWTPSDGAMLTASITAMTAGLPDLNTVYASETWDTSLLDVYDSGVPTNNNFSCDPDIDAAQTIIFDPPATLAGGTEYAFVIEGVLGSTTNDMILGYELPANDHYAGGEHYDCNVPSACTKLTPATWDLSGGTNHDVSGMAWFDNITIVNPINVDSWLENFLQMLGMNSVFGKLSFAVGVGAMVMLAILFRGGPPLIALAIGGMSSTAFVTASLIDPQIVLTAIAVIGAAVMFGMIRGFSKGNADG